MDRELYNRVSVWFEEHKDALREDISRMVRIPSISEPAQAANYSREDVSKASVNGEAALETQAQSGSQPPFGDACRAAMDEMLAIGREHGFYTENYEYYVGSIGAREKNWDHMIGLWNHLDVVPVGNGWQSDPFDPVWKEPFLIGRGAQDNKGPAVGMLYVMECLRELEIPLTHELCLFVGCDEERGMEDLKYYTAHYPCPALSMIADSGFPVCYGEKGILEGRLVFHQILSADIRSCTGGSASNMIPDRACAVLRYWKELEAEMLAKIACEDENTITVEREGDSLRVIAHGMGKHSAFPEGSRNAIYELGRFLFSLECLSEADRNQFGLLAWVSEKYYGERLGIAFSDEVSGRTTCAATLLNMEDNHLVVNLNIRYAITAQAEKMKETLSRRAKLHGMTWEEERDSAPNYFPKTHPAVDRLTNLYNEITGEKTESFVMGGGTYARKLPNAFAYGVGGMRVPTEDARLQNALCAPGHGGAHEPDEVLNLHLLLEALKIYTMALIELNECPLHA